MTDIPVFVQTLRDALVARLGDVGLQCEVEYEPVQGTKMYRFFVYSDGFAEMGYTERQSLIWRITENALPPHDAIKVSMILTLTPDEVGER